MKTLIAVIFSFFLIADTNGCDCFYNGPFTTVAPGADLVALVKVKRYTSFITRENTKVPVSMEVEIVKRYLGKEVKKTITVWGDNGFLCRPYLDTFLLKKMFVVAFKQLKQPSGQNNEKPGDYFIDACGGYWLSFNNKNSKLVGDYDGKTKEVSISTMRSFLLKKN